MKRLLFLSILSLISFWSFSQYIPIAKQGRVWYSHGKYNGNIWTEIIAVEGDSLISGTTYPLLVEKNRSLVTTDTLGYLDEDTVAGTLSFNDFTNSAELYDFSLNIADTVLYGAGFPEEAIVDTVYTITDFKGISRKVIEFRPGPNSFCGSSWDVYRPWVEGLGGGFLLDPLPLCNISHIAIYDLKCVFDGQTKIFGDTVQECYRERIGLVEQELQNLDIYPNPVKDELVIDSDIPVRHVEIYDLQGRMILARKDPFGSVDVKELPAGVFILHVTDQEGKVSVGKFQKE